MTRTQMVSVISLAAIPLNTSSDNGNGLKGRATDVSVELTSRGITIFELVDPDGARTCELEPGSEMLKKLCEHVVNLKGPSTDV